MRLHARVTSGLDDTPNCKEAGWDTDPTCSLCMLWKMRIKAAADFCRMSGTFCEPDCNRASPPRQARRYERYVKFTWALKPASQQDALVVR